MNHGSNMSTEAKKRLKKKKKRLQEGKSKDDSCFQLCLKAGPSTNKTGRLYRGNILVDKGRHESVKTQNNHRTYIRKNTRFHWAKEKKKEGKEMDCG